MKRKIAESINLRVNLKNFQHIELVKYAEEEIEYNSKEERIKAEKALTTDLVESLQNSMQIIVDGVGKGRKEVVEVEDAIIQTVPEWLDNKNIPNIAKDSNPALDKKEKIALKQKDDLETCKQNEEEMAEFEPSEPSESSETDDNEFFDDDDDIFG